MSDGHGIPRPDEAAARRHADGAAPAPGEEALFAALDRTRADLAAARRPPVPAGLVASMEARLAAERAGSSPPVGPAPARPGDRRDPRRPGRRRVAVGALGALAVAAVVVVVGIVVGIPRAAPSDPVAGPAPVVVAASDLPRAFRAGLGARDPSPLSDPATRAGCLVAHGLPAGTVPLGTRAVVVDGRPGTLLVLATGQAGRFRLLVVGLRCAPGEPDTVAETTVGG